MFVIESAESAESHVERRKEAGRTRSLLDAWKRIGLRRAGRREGWARSADGRGVEKNGLLRKLATAHRWGASIDSGGFKIMVPLR